MQAIASAPASLCEARQRIEAAYDPQLFQAASMRLTEVLTGHFADVQASSKKVLNWNPPPPNVERAVAEMNQPPAADRPARFAELAELILARGHNLHDPRYVGHQVPPPVPLAGLFDAVVSATNQVMAIYEMGPWVTAIEHAVVSALGEKIGWAGTDYAGIVTHGGSLANLTALLTARNVALPGCWEQGVSGKGPPAVLVSHADAHYCIARSAGMLGLGTQQLQKAELDSRRRIDPDRLDAQLGRLRAAGHPIIAVVACACATPIGAFDPLEDIAAVCRRHEVWLHVDAAHGGAALFSGRHRHILRGLDQADSLIWDAHKMLFVPALCAFLFYKDKRQSYAAFQQDAPYLFDPSAPDLADFDGGLRTVECTKRAAATGLWGIWSIFGPQLFEDLVDVTFDLAQVFHAKLGETDDFVALHEPQCNILVFRHVPAALRDAAPARLGEFQLRLRRRVIESGQFYVAPTAFQGVAALRVTLINPLTTGAHLDDLLDVLRREGQALL